MRVLIAVLMANAAFGMDAPIGHRQHAEETSVQQVLTFLNSDPRLQVSVLVKPFPRMGDSAAVAVLNVIGNKSVSEEEAERILEILAMAFETPRIIRNPADRTPAVTLSLLDSGGNAAAPQYG